MEFSRDEKNLPAAARNHYPGELCGLAAEQGFEAHLINPFADNRWEHLDPTKFFASKGGGHLGAEGLGMYSQLIHELLLELALIKPLAQETL